MTNQTRNALDVRVAAYLPMTSSDLKKLCAGPLLNRLLGNGTRCVDGTPQIADDPPAKLEMLLTEGFTSCDSSVDTIACEKSGEQIELNIRDFSYTTTWNGPKAFGPGQREVLLDKVIAHEIGHWLGLGHSTATASLMSETIERAQCVGDEDIEALRARNENGPTAPLQQARLRFR